MITYPCRCEIIDVSGGTIHGMEMITPDESKQHIGKKGTARLVKTDMCEPFNEIVEITLDDDNKIFGHECWWAPVEVQINGG